MLIVKYFFLIDNDPTFFLFSANTKMKLNSFLCFLIILVDCLSYFVCKTETAITQTFTKFVFTFYSLYKEGCESKKRKWMGGIKAFQAFHIIHNKVTVKSKVSLKCRSVGKFKMKPKLFQNEA